MKKIFGVLILVITILSLSSCTENGRARSWGGKQTINLEPNQKLVNVTWKETDLWILTRTARPGESYEVYKFTEKSTWGVMEGEITIVETITPKLGVNPDSKDIDPQIQTFKMN